jgi:transposase-like protein
LTVFLEIPFQDATDGSLLSRTAVSQITGRLWHEYEALAHRDLSGFAVTYFFVDGVAERGFTPDCGAKRAVRLGITEEGRRVLLHPTSERKGHPGCTAFFQDVKCRGLADPLLAVTDGGPGSSEP